ncbi:MAG: Single-stranded DNA-binding protein A [candidate division WS2 bacterium]|nr:Single-stranded DNA-binding protein A [Candidatus Psychracetigena formicireducens]MBT9150348.1 Single-stranded DNA-binding protein A [Candidatus Psychracetigena formicireducens]
MLNRVTLIGRLTRDPELKYLPQGIPVATFSVAVGWSYTGKDGVRKENTDFFNCVAWRNQAEFMGRNGTKGRLVFVEGRLQNRSWDAADGTKRRVTEVVTNSVIFLERKPGEATRTQQETELIDANQGRDPFDSHVSDDTILENFLKDDDTGGF